MPLIDLKWEHYDAFNKRIISGIYQGKYQQSLGLFHCYTKFRMEIALNALECLEKFLPPMEMQEYHFRCGLHSFLTHVKSAIDSFTEEINILYGIDPKLTDKGKTMSIERLLDNKRNNKQKLTEINQQLFNEISNMVSAEWFKELKTLRDKEAVHGAISSKHWQIYFGMEPVTKLGMDNISDLGTWCPKILEEANKFFERCYQLM